MERASEQEELFNPIQVTTIPDLYSIPSETMEELQRSLEWLENYHEECEQQNKRKK